MIIKLEPINDNNRDAVVALSPEKGDCLAIKVK